MPDNKEKIELVSKILKPYLNLTSHEEKFNRRTYIKHDIKKIN
jgi:hypothetical protein